MMRAYVWWSLGAYTFLGLIGILQLLHIGLWTILVGLLYLVLPHPPHLHFYPQKISQIVDDKHRLYSILAPCLLIVMALILTYAFPINSIMDISLLEFKPADMKSTIQGFPHALLVILLVIILWGGLSFAALAQASTIECSAILVAIGAAFGVLFSHHLIMLLIYLQMLPLAVTALLWASQHERAERISMRYLLLHMMANLLFFAGLALMVLRQDSLAPAGLDFKHFGHYCILIGVLIMVAAPPFWDWFAETHMAITDTGRIFLSALCSTTGIFVLMILFSTLKVLISLGMLMILYGIVHVFNVQDVRRMLAYSVVVHLGYALVGIGIGTGLGLLSAVIQTVMQVLVHGVLILCLAQVFQQTARASNDGLGNAAIALPYTALCAIFAGLVLSGLPFTMGYEARILLFESSSQLNENYLMVIHFAAGATPLYIGLRWVWLVFFRDTTIREWLRALVKPKQHQEWISLGCIFFVMLPLVLTNIIFFLSLNTTINWHLNRGEGKHIFKPEALYTTLNTVDFYALTNLVNQLQLLFSGVLVFLLLKRFMLPDHPLLYGFSDIGRYILIKLQRFGRLIFVYYCKVYAKLAHHNRFIAKHTYKYAIVIGSLTAREAPIVMIVTGILLASSSLFFAYWR